MALDKEWLIRTIVGSLEERGLHAFLDYVGASPICKVKTPENTVVHVYYASKKNAVCFSSGENGSVLFDINDPDFLEKLTQAVEDDNTRRLMEKQTRNAVETAIDFSKTDFGPWRPIETIRAYAEIYDGINDEA